MPDSLERRVFRSRFDDGLLDLVLGAWCLGLAADLVLRQGWLAPGVALAAFVTFRRVRARWILPRMGMVVFRESTLERQARLKRRFIGVQAIVLVLGITLAVLKTKGLLDPDSIRVRAIFGLVLGCSVSTAAIVLDLRRLYLLAIMLAAAVIGGALAESPSLTASLIAAAGATSLAIGAVLMARFLAGSASAVDGMNP